MGCICLDGFSDTVHALLFYFPLTHLFSVSWSWDRKHRDDTCVGLALETAHCFFFFLLSQFLGSQQLVGDKTLTTGVNSKANFQGIVFLECSFIQ